MLHQNLVSVGFLPFAVGISHECATRCPKPSRKLLAKAVAGTVIVREKHKPPYALQLLPIVKDKLESVVVLRINVRIARNGRQDVSMGVLVRRSAIRDRHRERIAGREYRQA